MNGRERVLVVEDEADVSRYLSAALEDEGYEVLVAFDADEGMLQLRAARPAIVCLDLVMPGRTGLSLYRELRSAPDLTGIPIIVVTGISPEQAREKLGLGDSIEGPDAYIEKPVDLPRFLEEVRRLLSAERR